MEKRCLKLVDALKNANLSAMLVTDMKNVMYFSGFSGSAGYLVISEDMRIIVTDSRYTEQAGYQAKGFEIKDSASFDISDIISDDMFVGFEDISIVYAEYRRFAEKIKNLVPVAGMLTDIRAVKDSYETECIEKAACIADSAFEHILDYIKIGMTEKEIAFELEMYMRTHGADGLSFDTIVAAGERGAMPHAQPGDKKISRGGLVVMDFGCTYKGYCSDMTRTVAIGDVPDKCIEIYEAVRKVQSECLEMVRPGACGRDIHMYSSKVLNGAYPGCYGHGLGHGVGLEIHESPVMNNKLQKPLVCGNIVTVEPGIYVSGLCGVRIEDLVLVTEDGYRTLSDSTKDLVKII